MFCLFGRRKHWGIRSMDICAPRRSTDPPLEPVFSGWTPLFCDRYWSWSAWPWAHQLAGCKGEIAKLEEVVVFAIFGEGCWVYKFRREVIDIEVLVQVGRITAVSSSLRYRAFKQLRMVPKLIYCLSGLWFPLKCTCCDVCYWALWTCWTFSNTQKLWHTQFSFR